MTQTWHRVAPVERREDLDAAMTDLFAADGPALLCIEQDAELL